MASSGSRTRFHLALGIAIGLTAAAFAWLFLNRRNPSLDHVYMVPFWALVILLYVYWGIFLRSALALHFALVPLPFLAAFEILFGAYTWADQNFFHPTVLSRQESAAPALLQRTVDQRYEDLFARKRFFSDGFRPYVLPANVQTTFVTTNEDGFRTRPKSSKPVGTVRVALLGGSAAFGWQAASDEYTVAAQMEKQLNEKSGTERRYEVVNFGVPAGNSFIDRSIVAGYVEPYDIDALLILTGNNDINGSLANVEEVIRFSSNYMNHSDDGPYLRDLWFAVSHKLLLRLLDQVYAFKFILDMLAPGKPSSQWIGEVNTTDGYAIKRFLTEYMANMEDVYKLSARWHLPVLVVQQPTMRSTLYNLGPTLSDPEDRRRGEALRNSADEITKLNTSRIQGIVQKGDEAARKYGYRYIDGNEAFFGYTGPIRQGRTVDLTPNAPLFISSTHYTAAGSRLLAEFIVNKMIALKVIR